jgi:iron(III) transport system ATP-binding protein
LLRLRMICNNLSFMNFLTRKNIDLKVADAVSGGIASKLVERSDVCGLDAGVGKPRVLEAMTITHGFRDGTKVLQDFSIQIDAGEIISLLGPSGCGKTTTLRLIAGLEPLQKGTIKIGGSTASSEGIHTPPENRNVAMMFQDYALFPHLSVFDNVMFGLGRISREERRDRAIKALDDVGLSEYWDRKPATLSGGQQQRVALARAIAPNPQLLLLDEPFSDLDTELRRKVRTDTIRVLKSAGVGALMVTHDPEEALYMSDRIAVMKDGQIEQIGPPMDLYNNPRSLYVARLFSEINEFLGIVKNGMVETALGLAPASELKDGELATVMIRPEHVLIGDEAKAVPGAVDASLDLLKYLGRDAVMQAKLDNGDEVIIRTDIRNLPLDTSSVPIALDFKNSISFKK